MSLWAGLADGDLDPRVGPSLAERLPGLATAMDAAAMAGHVQRALEPAMPVDSCAVGPAVYLGDACLVRYDVQVAGRTWLLNGRVFADEEACASYVAERLAPLAAEAEGRTSMAAFGRLAGSVPELRLALSVFPVDGELPTLVAATDPAGMRGALQDAVDLLSGGRLTVAGYDVELGHYGRQHRCLLRYQLQVQPPKGPARPLVVYGKITADDRGAVVPEVVEALRMAGAGAVAVPRALGYLSDLRLGLFEALPGVPSVSKLLKARLDGVPAQTRRSPTLESALDACARIAGVMHTSGVEVVLERSFETDTSALEREMSLVRPLAPRLAAALEARLADTAVIGAGGAHERALSHGDYSYTQVIFDGDHAGLVDFDKFCQAEPALDLGHFLAYLDLAGRKATGSDPAVLDALRQRFLTTYDGARGLTDVRLLRERVALFETLSLLRLAVHSWQKLKPKRLRLVLDALDARPVASPRDRSSLQ